MLQIHNSLTGAKEAFTPIQPGQVRMYACGPTVYNPAHLGNFRTFRPLTLLNILNPGDAPPA